MVHYGKVSEGITVLKSFRGSPNSLKFRKPIVSGILQQYICDDFDEGITVLNSRTVVYKPRVGQEFRHAQYIFSKFLELGNHLE